MYFIIEAGGTQYKVQTGSKIWINNVVGESGASCSFRMIASFDKGKVKVNSGAKSSKMVLGTVQKLCKGPKKISFYLRRRKNSRCKQGHRQPMSQVHILGLSSDDKPVQPS